MPLRLSQVRLFCLVASFLCLFSSFAHPQVCPQLAHLLLVSFGVVHLHGQSLRMELTSQLQMLMVRPRLVDQFLILLVVPAVEPQDTEAHCCQPQIPSPIPKGQIPPLSLLRISLLLNQCRIIQMNSGLNVRHWNSMDSSSGAGDRGY